MPNSPSISQWSSDLYVVSGDELSLSRDIVADIIKLITDLTDITVELSSSAAHWEMTNVLQQMHQRLTTDTHTDNDMSFIYSFNTACQMQPKKIAT